MTVPTISSPCVGCGMEKGHNILYCPTCTLVQRQEEANKIALDNQTQGSSGPWTISDTWEFIGGLIGIYLFIKAAIWLFA